MQLATLPKREVQSLARFVDTFEAEYDGAYFYPAEGLDCFVVNLDGVLEEIDPEEDS